MCGIVGYIGYEQATPLLIMGLQKLEYRGYDSAGVAVHAGEKLDIVKANGKLQVLSEKLNTMQVTGHLGIGHTRWATHGKPSEKNSHPQVSQAGKFAVVHNGIIENYITLKDKLQRKGIKFCSDTDTEVVAQLLEFYYDGDILDTVSKLMQEIEGAYALGIVCADRPDELIAVKKASPLIIGVGKDENFIASDVTAIISRTKNIIRLDDEEFAVLRCNGITVYDKNKNILKKEISQVDYRNISVAKKSGYEHFMLKEIMEQPKAILDTVKPRIKNGKIVPEGLQFTREELKRISKICILACGSAYHAGYVAKYIFEKLLRKPVEIEVASEFRYKEPIIDESVLVIAISQSGETADTLAALKEAKRLGAKVLSIVNVVGSAIARDSDNVLYTWAGPEIAVATTKAYSTQLSVVYMLALYMAEILEQISASQYDAHMNELLSLPQKIEELLKQELAIKALAEKFYNCKNVFFIGRNVDYAVSLEGSLKLKEISYVHSEAYAAGELKHGTISLIEDNTLVVALATNDKLFDKMVSNIKEVKARGAVVLSVTTEEHKEINSISDFNICIPKVSEMMSPSLSVVPLQLFAYYIALFKGCDIDKPRNLAKSVTVE